MKKRKSCGRQKEGEILPDHIVGLHVCSMSEYEQHSG